MMCRIDIDCPGVEETYIAVFREACCQEFISPSKNSGEQSCLSGTFSISKKCEWSRDGRNKECDMSVNLP